jgi:hypothetical protein
MKSHGRRKKTTYQPRSQGEDELETSQCGCDSRLQVLEGLLLERTADLDSLLEAYASMTDEVDYLKRLNRWLAGGQTQNAIPPPIIELPVPSNLTDAIRLAEQYLSDRLEIHPDAPRSIDELDSSLNSRPWAQMTLLAFKALHAYAAALHAGEPCGSFWTWCEASKSPHAWLATQKKLAMGESNQLMSNRKLRAYRELPISSEVVPSGKVEMTYHIKIATGGALAPRIYFHIDSTAAMIHIGFIGPHKLMPNTQIGSKK